jgi:penicillin-binding protein 2
MHAALAVTLLLGVIVIRLIQLQVHLSEQFTTRCQKNFLRLETTQPLRGNITDRNGKLMVTNRPLTSLAWQGSGNRTLSTEQLACLAHLGHITNSDFTSPAQLQEIAYAERRYTRLSLARDLSFEQLCKIAEQLPNNPNVCITHSFERYYPHGSVASHVVGYLGYDVALESHGKTGLEKLLEYSLKGKTGFIMHTVNSAGKKLAHVELEKAHAGMDIQTTIDLPLQKLCERIFPSDHAGALIVMDPHDGSLLALVSRPDFDPSLFLKPLSYEQWQALQVKQPFLNRACTSYPPGSIFKLVTISAALEHGLIDPHEHITCTGNITCGNRTYWCHRRQGHGELSTAQAIAQSCNIPFYNIGKHIDVDVLAEYANKFGLGKKTGIPLQERAGLIPTKQWKLETKGEQWWLGETLSVTIGQSFVLATPLQVAMMISAIYSGYLVKPRILLDSPIESTPLDISEETRAFLKKSMRATVKKGTGRRVKQVTDIEIYAKTSTAQTSDLTLRKCGPEYLEHGWFVATFQYKDHRPLTLVALVENIGTAQAVTLIARNFLVEYKRYADSMQQTAVG